MKKRKEQRRITLRTQKERKSFPLNVRSQFFFGSSFGGGGGGAALDLFLGRMFLKASNILIQLKGLLGLSENKHFYFRLHKRRENKVIYKACRTVVLLQCRGTSIGQRCLGQFRKILEQTIWKHLSVGLASIFITLGSFSLISQSEFRPNSCRSRSSIVASPSTISIWRWIFFLYRSVNIASVPPRAVGRKVCKIQYSNCFLSVGLIFLFDWLTMVRCSKGGWKVSPIPRLLPYDLLFKGWSWNFPADGFF